MKLYDVKYFSVYSKKWITQEIVKSKKDAISYKEGLEKSGKKVKIVLLKAIKI